MPRGEEINLFPPLAMDLTDFRYLFNQTFFIRTELVG